MKSNYVNASSVKTVLRNLFFALSVLIFSSASVHAQAVRASYTTAAPAPLEPVVTYLGSGEEEMSFNMKYDNASGERCVVTILDSNGEILFDQVFADKKFNKTFKVPSELGNLTFVVRNIKTRAQKKIAISTERRFVEEVSVTKVY
jgi:hypothetical protein